MEFGIFQLAREVIDLRSFSNLWYWIVLAVLWSTVSHWALGVPYDLVARARRGNAQADHDMRVLAEVNANRLLALAEYSGAAIIGVVTFFLTGLAVLGWGYGNEFCQALFLLMAPLGLIGAWSVRTARALRATHFDNVPRELRRHRMGVQGMGVVFIFVTAFWGMYVNVNTGPLFQ